MEIITMNMTTKHPQPAARAPASQRVLARCSGFRSSTRLFASTLLLALSGCANIQVKPGFEDIQQNVAQHIPQRLQWNQGPQDNEAIETAVKDLLNDTLTLEEAVQIALLNNRLLQSRYENLGIAQADLVQAGLLQNPVFTASIRSRNAGPGTNREFSVVENFLNVFTIPARKILGTSNFERAKLEVAKAALDLATEVKLAYYWVQADQQALELFRQAAGATEAAAELSRRQHQAGTLSRREQSIHQVFYAQTLLEVGRTESQIAGDRERLNRLLGLWGQGTVWILPQRLPEVPESIPAYEHLESLAIKQRLDLAAAKKEMESLAYTLGLTRNTRFLSVLGIGISTEHDADGGSVTGPTLELGLPLFDQGQAKVARSESQLHQAEQRVTALATDIRSRVREARIRTLAALDAANHYRRAVLPLHQTIVAESQLFYNGMLLGVYDLLIAKQNQINAGREYIAAIRDYWLAYTDLEHALGGHFPGTGPAQGNESEASEDSQTLKSKNQH
ncbi:MAG: TolC family protein [Burkholderiales bacterium]